MYLLNWNPDEKRIEASFGGFVSRGEALVFADELREMLVERRDTSFSLVVDYSTASRLDENVNEIFAETRETCLFSGADKITFIARDESEASRMTSARLQQVLEGREEYVAYGMAA